ncbi:hypothetical protein CLV81_2458 [Flagellimonas meridianipacifica]|uniref:Uncharacterized protein n=1 Tax=Flagellimonas meridianipacifica TaxID=1080225 RepID=A0A2T0M9G1_9FLAO|nr:hypothetical protein CLV81_2458 [Allomuricauda pacifica]
MGAFCYLDRFTLTNSKQAFMISKNNSTVKKVCIGACLLMKWGLLFV